MKEGKISGIRGKTGGILCMAAVMSLTISLLAGCSREQMETQREIDHIYHEAEKTALCFQGQTADELLPRMNMWK